MTNETELVELLTKYGFKEIFAEDYGIKDKIKLFNAAKLIFQEYGAGTITMIYCENIETVIFNSPPYKLDKNIKQMIQKHNKLSVFNYFEGEVNGLKFSPWNINLTKVTRLLEKTYKLKPIQNI